MYKYLVVVLLCIVFAAGTAMADSVRHVVSVKSIDNQLSSQFPFSKSFQSVQVVFSEPKALVNALDKSLKLQMMITSKQQKEVLIVKAIFKGKMVFNDFSEAYIFEDLTLDKFKLQHDSYTDSSHIVKTIKQSLLNDFDDIVLVNLEQFATELPNRQADSIDISIRQVSFIWN